MQAQGKVGMMDIIPVFFIPEPSEKIYGKTDHYGWNYRIPDYTKTDPLYSDPAGGDRTVRDRSLEGWRLGSPCACEGHKDRFWNAGYFHL